MLSANQGVLKRTYDYVALFALLHVVAALGVSTYVLSTGVLTPEKVQAIASVLRGDQGPEENAAPETDDLMDDETETDAAGLPDIDQMAEGSELLRLEAQRIKAELDQRLTLNNNIMLRVTTMRDAFKKEQASAQAAAQETLEAQQTEGFRKQLSILEALSPKVAVEHLLNMEDIDDAARVLLEMDTRKSKKIVEAAKGGQELQRMRTILRRVRDVAPDRSGEFESNAAAP